MGNDGALTPGWNELAPCIFRPAKRPRPEPDALSVLDALEKRENDKRRFFVCETHRDNARVDVPTLWSATGQRALRPEPPPATARVLGVDADNVDAAEERAREASRRMASWGATLFWRRNETVEDRVIWLVEENAWIPEWSQLLHFRREAQQKLQPHRFEPTTPPNSGERTRDWRWKVEEIARRDLHFENVWKEKLAAEPNPFEPIVAIWRLGYAFADIHQNGIILVANAPSR